MLYLFNKLKAKKGIRFTYQTCLISFAVAILSFFFASTFIMGTDNKALQYVIGCVGGVLGSWAIGAFFMVPYLIPAQVSSVEEKLTGRNHSAMYFAAQALMTSIVGAISGSLIYVQIKMLFISREAGGVVWAENIGEAAEKFGGVSEGSVFNLGTLLIPFIVCIVCILGAVICRKFPRDFTHREVALEFKKQYPDIDLGEVEPELCEEKEEIVFVQIALSILSGFIFGFVWLGFLLKSLKETVAIKSRAAFYLLSAFIPFANIYCVIKAHDALSAKCRECGAKRFGNRAAIILSNLLFPILPINIVNLVILQVNVNRLYAIGEDKEC
jgi:hypothetical protein